MVKKSKALVKHDERFAADIQVAEGMEAGVAAGSFISFKGGIISVGGEAVPGNKIAVVILSTVMENLYYKGPWDPSNPAPPDCYGFGQTEGTVKPHEAVENPMCDVCIQCDFGGVDAWGSADTGKGKACKNTRRIAIIPAGTFDARGDLKLFEKVSDFEDSELVFAKLPVTSVKGYSLMVKKAASTLNRPPYGIFTEISVVPDGSVFRVIFNPIEEVPDDLIDTIIARHEEADAAIVFPYATYEDKEDTKKPVVTGGNKSTKKTTPKTGRRKF